MTVQEALVEGEFFGEDELDKPRRPSRRRPGRLGDIVLKVIAGLVLVYLFIPIFVIILFSFNNPSGKFNYQWQGFTLDNWADPFKYPQLIEALKTSLSIAAVSTVIASVLGTLLAIALVRQRFRGRDRGRQLPRAATYGA